MMIHDGGRPGFEALNQRHQGAVMDIFQRQRPVQLPPQAAQNVAKILRRGALAVHPPGKGAVKMHMRIDHARHDQLSGCAGRRSGRPL